MIKNAAILSLSRFLLLVSCAYAVEVNGQAQQSRELSIDGFIHWKTGRDSATTQLLPAATTNALIIEDHRILAHVKFKVVKYGELSFPIAPSDATEAPRADLHKSRFLTIEYKANHEVILQLRQTAIHGGVHNHVILPASAGFTRDTIYFSSFKGGLTPLDLSNVAKFNFAFLGNNTKDQYADLIIRSFKIDQYEPAAKR